MADELRARLSVDTSGFKAGMSDAASSMRTVQQVSGELRRSLVDLADAESELGKAAAEGSSQAAGIIEEYREKVDELREELTLLKASQDAVNSSEREGAAATDASSAAIGEETVALRNNISARMAATAEIRLAEGGIQGLNRAAAAYLTTLPGVATAAQAAFAIAGPIAVIAVLGQLVHAIDGVIDDYKSLGDAARQAAIDEAAAAAHGIVTVQPKVGISERIARFAKSFTSNADAPGAIQSSGGSDQTVRTAAGVERLNAAQTQVLLSQNRLNEAGLKGSALAKQKQTDIQSEIDLLYKQANALGDVLYASQQVIRNQESTQEQVKVAQEQIKSATEARDEINTRIQVLGNNKQAEAKIQSTDDQKDDGKLARSQMEEAEKRFAELNTKLPEEAAAFWRKYVDLFQQEGDSASREYTQALEKLNHFTDEFEKNLGKGSSLRKKYEEEQVKLADLKVPSDTIPARPAAEREGEDQLARVAAQGAIQAAELAAALDKQSIAAEVADGSMTKLQAAERIAGDDAKVTAAKIAAISEELERFKKASQSFDAGLGIFRDPKEQAQYLQLQNALGQAQGQGKLQAGQDQRAIATQFAQPYITAANDIVNAFDRAFIQIGMKQKTWQQAMAGVLVSLELDAAQSVEKWVLKWVDGEALTLAKHVLTNQAKVASDTASATEQAAVQTAAATAGRAAVVTVAVADILSYAAVAAAAAAAAAAVGGPAAMAIAAGAAYSEVSAFAPLAAFDVGTPYVPKTGVAMIHRGEQIVTESNNRELMDFVRSAPSSRSSTTHVRSTINNHYNQPRSTPSGREQAAGLRDMVKRGHRFA